MNHIDRSFGRCLSDRFSHTLALVKRKRPEEVSRDDPRWRHDREDESCPSKKELPKGGDHNKDVRRDRVCLIGGFFVGIVLSDIIGIISFLLFTHAIGTKFLPIYMAIYGNRVRRRRAHRGHTDPTQIKIAITPSNEEPPTTKPCDAGVGATVHS